MRKNSCTLHGLAALLPSGLPSLHPCACSAGECVDKCPQHIDIPAVLESVVEELEGPGFEERVAMAKQMFKQK